MNKPAGGHHALASYDSTRSTYAIARLSTDEGRLSKTPDDMLRQSLTLPAAKVHDMADTNNRDDPPASRPETTVRVLDSADLLAGDRQVFIQHGSELYRLLVTRNGKLILQK